MTSESVGHGPEPPDGSEPRGPIQWVVWGALIVTLVGITFAFAWSRLRPAAAPVALPLNFPVPDFTLTNQSGQVVTLADLRGHVWVADIIFTRCGGPCPIMTGKMAQLQAALSRNSNIRLVTLTTDPDYDTPPVLRQFAGRFNPDFNRWLFLTGRKDQITRLAVDGLKLTAIPKDASQRDNEADLFIHSQLFVLVDKRGNVRAAFESDQPGAIVDVLRATEQLSRER